MKNKKIIYGVVGLGVLFLGYKAFKKRQKPNLELQKTESKPPILDKPAPSDNYNKEEATTKALITVKNWIKTYDGLSNEVLNEYSLSQSQQEKRLAELKAISNPSDSDSKEIQLLSQILLNSSTKKYLKDRISQLKNYDYEKVYSVLKDLYSQYSKTEVNKLMIILPTYLSAIMLGDDYKYSSDVFNKLSIDDKLYLNDLEFYKKFNDTFIKKYPRKNPNASVRIN